MKIRFSQGGGFAFLPRRHAETVLDVGSMEQAAAAHLRACIDDAGFFGLPERLGGAAGTRDADYYIITVEEAERRHTVRAEVPVVDEALWSLICAIRQCGSPPEGG